MNHVQRPIHQPVNHAPVNASSAQWSAGHPLAAQRGNRIDDLVMGFEAEGKHLDASKLGVLRDWLHGWFARDPHRLVVMATEGADRRGRLNRLRALREAIQAMGVPRENIKYTESAVTTQLDAAGGESRAAQTVWVKALDADSAELQVRSVASYFALSARAGQC